MLAKQEQGLPRRCGWRGRGTTWTYSLEVDDDFAVHVAAGMQLDGGADLLDRSGDAVWCENADPVG